MRWETRSEEEAHCTWVRASSKSSCASSQLFRTVQKDFVVHVAMPPQKHSEMSEHCHSAHIHISLRQFVRLQHSEKETWRKLSSSRVSGLSSWQPAPRQLPAWHQSALLKLPPQTQSVAQRRIADKRGKAART